uniref:Uncharacterized protein n=1 Tax=Panagrolaimus sp. PS1159 TaxID=55785 RepID=A0AC35FSX4_9BILA
MQVVYYVTAPAKSEKWLKELKEGNFLQFIVDAAAKSLVEKWGEYEEDEILWRNYAFISDVPECLRQACSIGQSKKRRHFFTMAVYYRMVSLMKELADEQSLGVFGYPVPLLLDIFREAPHYFAIVETASTEGNEVTK